jgi:hypothetical protein
MGEIKDPFAAVKWQQVLGGEGFCANSKIIGCKEVEHPKITVRRETGQLWEPSRSLSGFGMFFPPKAGRGDSRVA